MHTAIETLLDINKEKKIFNLISIRYKNADSNIYCTSIIKTNLDINQRYFIL